MSIVRLIALTISLLLPLSISAQSASSRGVGSAPYGFLLSAEVRAQALSKAKVNALEAYVAEQGAAKMRLFEQRRSEFVTEIDRYVLSAIPLSENQDKAAKTYTVTVRAEINTTLLQVKLDAGSAVAEAGVAERSMLTFVFVARAQDTAQAFDDRVYKRAETNEGYREKTSEGESFRGNSISTSGSRDVSNTVSIESGGSTTRRSDKISWKVSNAAEINTAMTGIFSAAGYEVVEADYVPNIGVDLVRQDYSGGDDLKPATLQTMAAGVRGAGISYVAVGTLDVGMQDRDPASGNVRVFVTVTGKVLNVSGGFPRTLSSVGPVQFAGLGPDQGVARTNALRQAAESAAQQMVNELNAKAVR